ncbi:hypothetical protein CVT26_004774 [Gymnopilus dilepis]|uniref:Phosphodiesterase n=1 Tax=Gymnopilus dilepis TaxID=231916 RepID=A0A409XZI9_9AGAR|nr:hypothetical protein CVT26_004774 [Gymnopilus dilepis]
MDTTSPHALKFPRDHRRRSADVGGLHLALASAFAAAEVQLAAHDHYNPSLDGNDQDLDNEDYTYGYHPHHRHPYHHHHQQFGARGQGWMGGEGGDIETMYAELLSDMYNETLNSLNDNSLDTTPPPVPENVRTRLIWQLDKWHFEPHKLPDEEVLACTLLLFEALFRVEGMEEVIPLSMDQITAFIHHLRRIYRHENKYHNFEHALDVLQATQSYLKSAGVVPPPTILFQPPGTRWVPKRKVTDADADVDSGSGSEQSLMATLGKRELFILYVGAIGHDVAHPGFSNVFMVGGRLSVLSPFLYFIISYFLPLRPQKNAQAPLAILFNHGSALEHMHSHLLLALMRRHGFAPLLDDPLHGSHLRKLLKEAVLATDMGVHGEFMDRLEGVVRGEQMSLCARQVVLCQALLKNADISNPVGGFPFSLLGVRF